LVLGLATRLAAFPLLFTMLTAAFFIHGDDPWAKKELAVLYAVATRCGACYQPPSTRRAQKR
jgi:uncharacterized membrane protein YphA (DoxX/SURF4 family)